MDSEMININNNYGSSKYRRQQLNKGIDILKDSIPLSQDDRNKLSQLQALHYACIYMRKQNLISNMRLSNLNNTQCEDLYKHIVGSQYGISDTIHGFIIAVSRTGHLIYVSDNVINYLGHSSIDVLLSADKFCDILHPLDESKIKSVLESDSSVNQNNNQHEFYTSWYVSKIRRRVYTRSDTKVKISGRFISNNSLFVALCTPMLRVADRDYMDYLVAASPTCFTTVHSLDLRFQEICEKGQTILDYKESELQGVSLYEMVNFKNLKDLRKNHKSLLSNKSQRGKLETVQLLMKNGSYLNCLVNMHYGNGNYIVCRFQAFSTKEMIDYENYSSMIYSYSSSHAFTDDLDGSDQLLQMSPSEYNSSIDGNDCDQFNNNLSRISKRRMDDEYDETSEGTTSDIELSPVSIVKRQRKSNKMIQSPSFKVENIKNEPIIYSNCSSPQQQYIPQPQVHQQQQQQQQIFMYNQPQPISPIPITDEMIFNLAAEFAQNNNNNNTKDFDADNLPDFDWETLNDILSNNKTDDFNNLIYTSDDSNGSSSSSSSTVCIPQQQQQYQFNFDFNIQQQSDFYFNNSNTTKACFNSSSSSNNNNIDYFTEQDLFNELLLIAEDGGRCH